MNLEIQPKYTAVQVECSCGNKFETRSTLKDDSLHLDICSKCHPFYTGKQKLIDTAGRVDRFKQKYARNKTKAKAE